MPAPPTVTHIAEELTLYVAVRGRPVAAARSFRQSRLEAECAVAGLSGLLNPSTGSLVGYAVEDELWDWTAVVSAEALRAIFGRLTANSNCRFDVRVTNYDPRTG